MNIEDKKVVVMTYELEVDGKIVDKATEDAPLDYIQGTGMLIPVLEKAVEGKQAGDIYECTVTPEEGYGEYDIRKVFDIPKESFMVDGKIREDLLEVGRFIPMLNSAGEVCQGMIMVVKEKDVTMDFNPPMAGKTLHFQGTIIAVREATEKELEEGLHGEFRPQGDHKCCHHHNGECCNHKDGNCCCHS